MNIHVQHQAIAHDHRQLRSKQRLWLKNFDLQPVLVAHVDRDRAIPAQVADVLVQARERRVGRPLWPLGDDGIRARRQEGDDTVLDVGSGRYQSS